MKFAKMAAIISLGLSFLIAAGLRFWMVQSGHRPPLETAGFSLAVDIAMGVYAIVVAIICIGHAFRSAVLQMLLEFTLPGEPESVEVQEVLSDLESRGVWHPCRGEETSK